MSAFAQIFRQEVLYRFKKPTTYIYFVILMGLAFADIYEPSGKGGGSGEILRNSPIVIYSLLNRYSLWLTFFVIGFTANAVYNDSEFGVDKFFYALPLSKTSYLLGKFFGALFVLFFLSIGIGLGAWICNLFLMYTQTIDGPLRLMTYLKGYSIMIIPNLFVFSAISFGLVTLSRNIVPAYLIATLSFIGFLISGEFVETNNILAVLLDPFGTIYFYQATHLWDIYEQNNLAIPITNKLLANRACWISLGVLSLAVAIQKFRFEYVNRNTPKEKEAQSVLPIVANPVVSATITKGVHLRQVLSLGWFEFKSLAKSSSGKVTAIIGILFLLTLAASSDGSRQYPVTYLVIENTNRVFRIFVYLVIVFFSAEIIWKRQSLKLSEWFDALPVPNLTFSGAVFSALFLICFFFISAFFLVGTAVQTFKGYGHYDFELYAKMLLLVILPDYLLFSILSIFFHTVIRNKYAGFLGIMLYWVGMDFLKEAGFSSSLLHFKDFPHLYYSDLNLFGHFWEAQLWFTIYWGLIAGILLVFATIFWNRGRSTQRPGNIKIKVWVRIGTLILLTLITGSFMYASIYISENILSEREEQRILANYEKKYKKYEHAPQPEITDIDINAEIYPSSQMIRLNGKYRLKNSTSHVVDSLHVVLDDEVDLLKVKLNGRHIQASVVDKLSHRFIYPLPFSLAPNDTVSFIFELKKCRKGFGLTHFDVVDNGTFIPIGNLLPSISGYSPIAELSNNQVRKKFGLPPKNGVFPTVDLNNEPERNSNQGISFEATLGTSKNQIAITKGELTNSWIEADRRYFRYKSSRPSSTEFAIFSGEYKTETSAFLPDSTVTVPLEIYYHHTHSYNIDTIMDAMRASVSYYHQNFGGYYPERLRLVEVPGFRTGARSFPETIAIYESNVFQEIPDKSTMNFPFFIVAHEAAHQWFGSQNLVRQPVKGAAMLNETLAQYAAYMVLKKEFGMPQVRQWLKFNLEQYLKGRVNDPDEVPLSKVEDQGYIFYHKGALAMFALQEYIGEGQVNQAIARCTQTYSGFLVNTSHLINCFRAQAPDSLQQKISDLFETVIIYENSLNHAHYRQLDKNTYELNMEIEAHKYSKDKPGTELPFNEWIRIETETANGTESKQFLIKEGKNNVSIYLTKKPRKVLLDPDFNFLDKTPDDNELKPVAQEL